MGASQSSEQRIVPRLSGDTIGPLRLRSEPLGVSLSAGVRDISIMGVGLLVEQDFGAGTSFAVEAGPGGKAVANNLTVQVRHATKLSAGRWLLGCKFSRFLTITDVEAMG